jgi:hypothetical protein
MRDYFVTVHSQCSKSHRQLQCMLQLACQDRVFSSELITSLYSGSSIQNASEQFVSCIQLSFFNCVLHPTPQTKL